MSFLFSACFLRAESVFAAAAPRAKTIFPDGKILLRSPAVFAVVALFAGVTLSVRLSSGVTVFVSGSLERVDLVTVVLSSAGATDSDFVLLVFTGVSFLRGVAAFESLFGADSLRDALWFLASL